MYILVNLRLSIYTREKLFVNARVSSDLIWCINIIFVNASYLYGLYLVTSKAILGFTSVQYSFNFLSDKKSIRTIIVDVRTPLSCHKISGSFEVEVNHCRTYLAQDRQQKTRAEAHIETSGSFVYKLRVAIVHTISNRSDYTRWIPETLGFYLKLFSCKYLYLPIYNSSIHPLI